MPFATDFQEVLDSLPADWTDLEFDLRIDDESRYIDGSVLLSLINAQPYSKAEWHWRIPVAHSFGHAAAAETVIATPPTGPVEGVVTPTMHQFLGIPYATPPAGALRLTPVADKSMRDTSDAPAVMNSEGTKLAAENSRGKREPVTMMVSSSWA